MSLTDTESGVGNSGTAHSTSYSQFVTSGGSSDATSADKTMAFGMGTGAPLMSTLIDASEVMSSADTYALVKMATFKDNVTETNAWSSVSSSDNDRSMYHENGNDTFDGDFTSSMTYGATNATNGLSKSDAGHGDAFQMFGYASDETSTQYTMPLFGTSDRWSKDVENAGRDGSHENDAQVITTTSSANPNGPTTTRNTVADTKGVYWDYKWHKETFESTSPRSFSEGNGHTNSTFLGKDSDHVVNGVNTFEETQYKSTSYGHHADGRSIMPPGGYRHDDNGWTLLDYAGAGTQTNGSTDNFTYYNEIEATHDWSHDVSWWPLLDTTTESDSSTTTVGSGTTATQTASSNTTITTNGVSLSWSSGPTVTTVSIVGAALTPVAQFEPGDFWSELMNMVSLAGAGLDAAGDLLKGVWDIGVGISNFASGMMYDPAGTMGQTLTTVSNMDPLDQVQLALDFIGFIPVIGEIADFASGVISLARGDNLGAALSFASMIPFLGTASGAAKVGRQVVKHGDEAVGFGAKMANNAEGLNLVRTGERAGFAKAAGNAVDGAAGKVGRYGSDIFDASTNQLKILQKNCFAPGTPVLTPKGARAIETLRPGDLVLSRAEDDVTADVAAHTVGALFELSARIWEVHVGGKLIETTAEHPFFVSGEGWTTANRLQPGDALVGHNEILTQVEKVVQTGRTATVYNLRVEEDHTYFVGDPLWSFSVWVHNANCNGGVAPNSRGLAGEALAGIEKNLTQIDSLSGKKNYRVPDGLTSRTLTEVKNVRYQYFSTQLQDSLHYAIMTGRTMILKVPRGAQLSQELMDVITAGWITLERF